MPALSTLLIMVRSRGTCPSLTKRSWKRFPRKKKQSNFLKIIRRSEPLCPAALFLCYFARRILVALPVGFLQGANAAPCTPAPGLSGIARRATTDATVFCSWVFVLGASAAPKPPRPVRPGASDFVPAVCGWRWSKMRRSIFANLPAFLRKDLQKTSPRLAASGGDNCVVPPQCSPPDPLFTAGGTHVGVRYCTLRLFYGSWDCRRGNTAPRGIS